MTVLNDLSLWFWRLLPANPILVRVVAAGGKRVRHLWARVIYLAVLFFVIFIVGQGSLTAPRSSLADLAKQSTQTFMVVSLVQLFLMSFIAPVFTAAAITQEKDANTFNILLTTPLSNAQIVLGSLLSRLYFVWVLLLAGLPIFCITMLFGGVTTAEVFQSFGLAACTALITGSLAIMISVVKIGTRRTIFSFFVGVAVYLIAIGWLGVSGKTALAEAPIGITWPNQMSWLAPLHPFLALLAVVGWTPPPPAHAVGQYGWPASWLLANPQYGYMVITTLASIVMVLISLLFLRKGAKEGETNALSRVKAFLFRGDPASERRRKPRSVWRNPIAWRETMTRGSAAGRSAVRWAYLGLGLLVGIVLLIGHEQSWWGMNPAAPAVTRDYLTALIWIELAIVLLVVTNTAATTLTREKESQTIEILLSTPLTSRYIVKGMLMGLVGFVIPMIAIPTITLLLFAFADLARGSRGPAVIAAEAFVLVPLLMVAFAAPSAMWGLSCSLRAKKTVQAVMWSTSLVGLAVALTWGCGETISTASGVLGAVIKPFTPFPAMEVLISPEAAYKGVMGASATAADIVAARWVRLISALVAAAVYGLITWSQYNSMVRNFDMTVRKQTA